MPYLSVSATLFMSRGVIDEEDTVEDFDISNYDVKDYSKWKEGHPTYKHYSGAHDCRDSLISQLYEDLEDFAPFISSYNDKYKIRLTIRDCTANQEFINSAINLCQVDAPLWGSSTPSCKYTLSNNLEMEFSRFLFPPQLGLFVFLISRHRILGDLKTTDYISRIIEERDRLFSREEGDFQTAFWTAFACYNSKELFRYWSYFLSDSLYKNARNISSSLEQFFPLHPDQLSRQLRAFIEEFDIDIPEDEGYQYDAGHSFRNYVHYQTGIRKLEKERVE